MDPLLLQFIVVAGLLVLTPGADTMLVLRNSVTKGFRAGLATMLGITSGVCVHAILSAAGLSLILVRSATAWEVVKFAGALYLVVLGLQSIRRSRTPTSEAVRPLSRPRTSFIEGLFTNILNPKVALFYVALLPQFVGQHEPVMGRTALLAGIHVGMGIIQMTLVALLSSRVSSLLVKRRVRQGIEFGSGLVLIGLGARLALERR